MSSPGQPLDAGTRAFMEPRFGQDFSQVRVHTDAKAAESTQAVNAVAYTVGRNVVFGAGQYAPGTSEGRRLMAHELTHVVQQGEDSNGIQSNLTRTDPGGAAEREAHIAADTVMQSYPFTPTQGGNIQLARQGNRDAGTTNALRDAGLPADVSTPPGESGRQTVTGLGDRKQEILKRGGTVLDMAVAMLETDTMRADFYPYGDGKTGDAANFGIFKQNWLMIRTSASQLFKGLGESDWKKGDVLNGDLSLDIQVLRASQWYYGDKWFAGHRNGATGLITPNTPDINNYKRAVYWIRSQINSDPRYLRDVTRFWVKVPPI